MSRGYPGDKQLREKAGSFSFQVVLILGHPKRDGNIENIKYHPVSPLMIGSKLKYERKKK